MNMYNAAPRPLPKSLRFWLERWFRSQSYMERKYCKTGHNLVYVPGYTPSNGWYECPECGATDLDKLKINYDKYRWYNF